MRIYVPVFPLVQPLSSSQSHKEQVGGCVRSPGRVHVIITEIFYLQAEWAHSIWGWGQLWGEQSDQKCQCFKGADGNLTVRKLLLLIWLKSTGFWAIEQTAVADPDADPDETGGRRNSDWFIKTKQKTWPSRNTMIRTGGNWGNYRIKIQNRKKEKVN